MNKLFPVSLFVGFVLGLPAQAIILDEEPPKAVVAPRPKKHQKSAIEIENERMMKELAAMKRQQKEANEETVQAAEPLSKPMLTIGSAGPGGGIIFYLDSSGEHGLEAKRIDEPALTWLDAMNKNYGSGWRLPTKEELNQLYLQKNVVGGFAINDYWSSTENYSYNAWGQAFGFGTQYDYRKGATNRVRAVRAF